MSAAGSFSSMRSRCKFNLLSDADVTFVLTSGGHNAGIVSEPGHPHRHYRLHAKSKEASYTDPDRWMAETEAVDGSWWPAIAAWLEDISGDPVDPPEMSATGYEPLCDAPGVYVFQE